MTALPTLGSSSSPSLDSTISCGRHGRRLALLLTFTLASTLYALIGAQPAFAARNLTSLSVGAGACWGGTVSYLVTVNSSGSGSVSGTLSIPTVLPAGVTSAF